MPNNRNISFTYINFDPLVVIRSVLTHNTLILEVTIEFQFKNIKLCFSITKYANLEITVMFNFFLTTGPVDTPLL